MKKLEEDGPFSLHLKGNAELSVSDKHGNHIWNAFGKAALKGSENCVVEKLQILDTGQ